LPAPVKGTKVIITPDRVPKIKKEYEESLVRCWRNTNPMAPKMLLEFHVAPQEVYASTPGYIFFFTPIFRGRSFTDAVMSHEFYHWSIHPKDIFRGLKELFTARQMLAKELKFVPPIVKQYGREYEDWSKFEYQPKELQFVQNLMGDWLINWHLYETHQELWKELWQFLYFDGTFYEKQKALKRDSTFILYLSVYNILIPGLEKVDLIDPQAEKIRDKAANIIQEFKKGRMSGAFTLKELAKIFHKFIQEDQKNGEGNDQGNYKCPKCGNEDFDVTGYEDPDTGKWVDVQPPKSSQPIGGNQTGKQKRMP